MRDGISRFPSSVLCRPSNADPLDRVAPRQCFVTQNARDGFLGSRAFTLLELLTVIAIIGVLATITLKIGQGVQQRSAVARAKVEMAIIASALEQYKAQYGDYPWTPEDKGLGTLPYSDKTGAQILFNALCGNIGPTGNQLPAKGRVFIELSKFSLWSTASDKMPLPDDPQIVNNWLDDPWSGNFSAPGKWYWYYYKSGPDWVSPSFLLYSHGPDGDCVIGDARDTGLLDDLPTDAASVAINADNIYLGRD